MYTRTCSEVFESRIKPKRHYIYRRLNLRQVVYFFETKSPLAVKPKPLSIISSLVAVVPEIIANGERERCSLTLIVGDDVQNDSAMHAAGHCILQRDGGDGECRLILWAECNNDQCYSDTTVTLKAF